MDPRLESNRWLWESWARIHERSDFYDLDSFRRGGVRLQPHEVEEVGDVEGKDLLHLQCHIGTDTLSWARLGARVTGVDFSPSALGVARRLAADTGLDARFVESEILGLDQVLEEDFDIVHTSVGVLWWLPDLRAWARVVARFLRPGGVFYIYDVHPFTHVFDDEAEGGFEVAGHYLARPEALEFSMSKGTYADPEAEYPPVTEYGWFHGLGEVVSAVAGAGLRIELLREFASTPWPHFKFLRRRRDGTYEAPPESRGEVPLMFSLRARAPARGPAVLPARDASWPGR